MKTSPLSNALSLCILLIISACQLDSSSHPVLLRAEQLMNEHPDSALVLLSDSLLPGTLSGKAHADWCLLFTQAQDKNDFIFTSDSLIRIACDYYEKHPETERLMLTYYYMGRVTHTLGDAPQAQKYYLKAQEIGDLSENIPLKARISSNLGVLYTEQRYHDEALSQSHKTLHLLQQINDTSSQSITLRNMGRIYWKVNKLDSAIYCYKQAEEFNDQLPSIYSELGGLFAGQGRYNEALSYLQKALHSEKNLEYRNPTYLSIGKLYCMQNKSDSAIFYLNKSKNSFRIETKAGSYYHLARLAKQNKDWPTYVTFQEQYETLRDSIMRQTQTSTMQQMQSLYNYQLREKENQALKLRYDITTKNYYIIILSVLLAVLIFSGCIAYWKRKWTEQKRHFKEVIKLQQSTHEKEIAQNTLQIGKLEEEIIRAIDTWKDLFESKKKLLELRNEHLRLEDELFSQNEEAQKLREDEFRRSDIFIKMHDLSKKLSDKDRTAYQAAVEKTYPTFKYKMQQEYPNLNNDDMLLCYYTRIKLSNKEMAHILNCVSHGIPQKKTRLYKNIFGIKAHPEDFNAYIESIKLP